VGLLCRGSGCKDCHLPLLLLQSKGLVFTMHDTWLVSMNVS
jgi:hypothetical protein